MKSMKKLVHILFIFCTIGICVCPVSAIVYFVLGKYAESLLCILGACMFTYILDKAV